MTISFNDFHSLYNAAVRLYDLNQYALALEKFKTCLFFLTESSMKENSWIKKIKGYITNCENILKKGPIPDNADSLNALADYYYNSNEYLLAISTYQQLIDLLLQDHNHDKTALANAYWNQAMAYKALDENPTDAKNSIKKNEHDHIQNVKRLVILAKENYQLRKDIQACNAYLSELASEHAITQFDEAIDYVRLGFTQSQPQESYKRALESVENALQTFKEVSAPSELDTTINGWCIRLEHELKRKFNRAPVMHFSHINKNECQKEIPHLLPKKSAERTTFVPSSADQSTKQSDRKCDKKTRFY